MEDQNTGHRGLRQPLPPLTRSAHAPLLPHTAVLDEILSPAGVFLWQLLQDATLWSTADWSARDGLFADAARVAAGSVPEVGEELDALGVLVRDPHPDAGPIIARMCDRVRIWAEERGLDGTALAFAQAAALADPEDARGAYEVGRLARRRAEYARAEVWYHRAAALANRSNDVETKALSFSGLANMYSQRGNYVVARRLKEKAVRLSQRHSLREVLGGACHDMAVLEFETGEVQSGMRYARRALRVLGERHDRTPAIVHDMAVALMDRCGAFDAAHQMLGALLSHLVRRDARLIGLANLARAAAARGETELFEAIWTDTWPTVSSGAEVGCLEGLIALGRGALSLRQWDRASQAGTLALAVARERREGRPIHIAEALLGAVESARVAELHVQQAPFGADPNVASFASDLLKALNQRVPVTDDLPDLLRAVIDCPAEPGRAYELGRALRAAGEYERGAAWLEHGARLAREAGNPRAEAMCLGGLGNLHVQRGDLALALDIHRRHLDLARREGLRDMEALALLDLCAVCFAMDRGDAGFSYAFDALPVLGKGHPLFPRLAHDLAMYLMESRSDFENALLLFQALQRCDFPPAESLLLRASLARAAAGAGRAQLFEDTWGAVWSAVQGGPDLEYPSAIFIQLAQGALIRGHYDLAERCARRAVEIATQRGEQRTAADAEGLVEAVVDAGKTRARMPVEMAPEHPMPEVSRLARGVASALRGGATGEIPVALAPPASSLRGRGAPER